MSDSYAKALTLPSIPFGSLLARFDGMSERDLVSRAQSGDIAAFEEIYRTHAARVYSICLRMVADPTRAEDLTQDAFVRAWEKLSSFRGKSAFATWLHRLTVNIVLGEIRSRGRRKDEGVPTEQLQAVPDPRPRRQSEVGIDLERALATLPAKARMVFVLHDVEGFLHQEIGELMGIAIGTSKAHLHRARYLLREELRS